MNSHEQYAALLDAFIDGALSERDAARVRAHLAECPECQAYVSDALTMRELFPGVEETAVPEGFTESVMAALPAQNIPWRKQWKKAALPLAACIAIALLLRGLYVLPMGATGGAAPEAASMDMDGGGWAEEPAQASLYGDFAENEESASEDADGLQMTVVTSEDGAAQESAAGASAQSASDGGAVPQADEASNGAAFKSAASAASAEGAGSQSDSRYSARRSDDADTMPPQTPELSEYRVASAESAPRNDAASASQDSNAQDMETSAAYVPTVAASGAAASNTSGSYNGGQGTSDGGAYGASGAEAELSAVTEAAPAEAEETYLTTSEWDGDASNLRDALSVSVWTLAPDAAPIMERYPPDAVTSGGVWYALTQSAFEDLCERFPDIEITAGPETMYADSLPDGAPPLTVPDAVYLFVPNSASE